MALYSPPTKNGIQKTLAAQLLSSATTSDPITFDDVDGIANRPGVLVINRVDSNGVNTPSSREYISYSGTSGSTVIIETRNADSGGAVRTHAVGSIVEFIPDVVWGESIYTALSNLVNTSTLAVDTTKVVTPTGSQTLTNKTLTAPVLNGALTGTGIVDDDTFASPSATTVPSSESTKAYIDANASVDWKSYTAVTPTSGTLDDPTFELTFAGVDLSTTLYAGMRIRITQSTVKYFIITKVAFSTDTTVTVYGGTDYDLVDTGTTAITAVAYSSAKAPGGFPLSPAKWTVRVTDTTDRSQASPTADVWYNLGSVSISIPIGIWRVWYSITAQIDKTGVNGIFAGLSTANNSVSDQDLITNVNASGAFTGHSLSKEKTIALTSKTTHYAITKTTASGATTLYNRNGATSGATLIIEAICSYL